MGSMASEPSSPQSSIRSRSASPDDILERAAADVKEYELENVNTFEANVKAKHNLIAQEKESENLLLHSREGMCSVNLKCSFCIPFMLILMIIVILKYFEHVCDTLVCVRSTEVMADRH